MKYILIGFAILFTVEWTAWIVRDWINAFRRWLSKRKVCRDDKWVYELTKKEVQK
jgi:hypothetical protein